MAACNYVSSALEKIFTFVPFSVAIFYFNCCHCQISFTVKQLIILTQWAISELPYENEFDLHLNELVSKTHFHMKGFELGLHRT